MNAGCHFGFAWEVFSDCSNESYAPATRVPEWFPVVKSEDTVHSGADGRSTIAPYSKKMEYRWAGLSLLLGTVSSLLLRIPFPRSVMTVQTQFSFLCQEWKMKIRIRMTNNLIERTREIVDLLTKLWLLFLLCFPFSLSRYFFMKMRLQGECEMSIRSRKNLFRQPSFI